MASALTVFIITIDLKRNIEDCPEIVLLAKRSFITSAFDARDGDKRLTYVKEFRGSSKSVAERYDAVLHHPDVSNFRVFTSSPDYFSRSVIEDPVTSKLDALYRGRKRRKSDEVPDINRVFVNNK